jgi:L-iditol 2-dehydrogenase
MCSAFRENLLEPGGFAEHVLVRERARTHAARRVPDDVEDAAAIFMEPAACVVRAVDHAALPTHGGAVVILGAGSMGLLHLLVVRAMFPEAQVVVVDPDTERTSRAKALGADAACGPGDPARTRLEALTSDVGADAVFDTVGGPQALRAGLALARSGGTMVLFAHAAEEARADFELNELFRHEQRVVGTYSGGPHEQARAFDLLCSGRLDPRPLVTHALPLERFDEGVALARERRALKVVFTPGAGAGAP